MDGPSWASCPELAVGHILEEPIVYLEEGPVALVATVVMQPTPMSPFPQIPVEPVLVFPLSGQLSGCLHLPPCGPSHSGPSPEDLRLPPQYPNHPTLPGGAPEARDPILCWLGAGSIWERPDFHSGGTVDMGVGQGQAAPVSISMESPLKQFAACHGGS